MNYIYQETGDISDFASDLITLDNALIGIPRNISNHLVSAGFISNNTAWISWNFQDGSQKTGDDLFGSLLFYKSALCLAELYTSLGNTTRAAYWTAEAQLIKDNISSLWDNINGMFLAASEQVNVIDIGGSAYACYLGIATLTQQEAIKNYI